MKIHGKVLAWAAYEQCLYFCSNVTQTARKRMINDIKIVKFGGTTKRFS